MNDVRLERMDTHGAGLIFLISQPRSGSTLLQHMLASHREIHTIPEPWLMLHFAYGLRAEGLKSDYNAQYAYLALQDVLKRIPEGEKVYVEAIRRAASHVYEKLLVPSGKRYFLDKTPRYYFIIKELSRVFPQARFILLVRNPLAVFSSIIDVNFKGDWWTFCQQEDRIHDVLTAPKKLLEGNRHLGERAMTVHYEELVMDPEKTLKALSHHIGVGFDSSMLNYGEKVKFDDTTFVDSKSIYKHESPVEDYLNVWKSKLADYPRRKLALAYLDALGEQTLNDLGYDAADLKAQLRCLGNNRHFFFSSWESFLKGEGDCLSWMEGLKLEVSCALGDRGIWGGLRRFAGYVLRRRMAYSK